MRLSVMTYSLSSALDRGEISLPLEISKIVKDIGLETVCYVTDVDFVHTERKKERSLKRLVPLSRSFQEKENYMEREGKHYDN